MSNIVNINSIAVLVMFMLTLVSPGDRNLSASALEPENSTSGNVSVDHFPIENDLSTEEEEEESLPAATVGTQEADSFVEDEDQTSKNNSELNASVWTASSNHEVSAKLATDGPSTICPNIRGTNKERTVVKCICQGMEVYVNGKCEPHEGVIIPVQHNVYYSKLESISEFDVIIQDVQCDPDLYLAMNFTQNQFQLRPRGDIVLLKEAGNLEEQRISKYCLIHHLDSQGYLTSTVKTCVPIPYVPRCCSYGYAMKDGVCQSAKTPEKFKPPIVLKPHSVEGVEGLEILTYINSLTCKYEPMRRIPLGYNGSHLLSLATNGLSLSWKPNEPRVFETFLFCPQYCIDGIEHSDGRVEYFASLCYMTNREFHEKACEKMPCIRKCCELGNSYDTKEEKCVLDSKSTFSLADITNSSRYYILPGYPLCEFFSEAGEEFVIDSDGQLTLNERRYPSTDYCVDITVNTTNRTPSAFVCGNRPFTWITTRFHIIPIVTLISLVFLLLSVACHLLVPQLLANGGVHQLCHILSLTIAFSSSFALNFFHRHVSIRYYACFFLAVGIQYGFLATFFWLNTMCFEVWRKTRKLMKYQKSKTYPEICFILYAWGIPLCISAVTVMMQLLEPHKVRNEIRPYIAIKNCWFKDDGGGFLYFYGPVALLSLCNMVLLIHTLMNCKTILRNSKKATKELKSIGRSTGEMSNHVQDFYLKFKLFALSVFCWCAEILSWKIPPADLWALTDILNALQGLFVFIILLTSPNKRKLIEEKFPAPFRLARRCSGAVCKCKKEPTVEDQLATSPPAAEPATSDTESTKTVTSVLEMSSFSSGTKSECCEASEKI